MCDMKIKWIEDSTGMDLEEFRKLCQDHKDTLAALMVTYPSTRGFFENNIQEICQYEGWIISSGRKKKVPESSTKKVPESSTTI